MAVPDFLATVGDFLKGPPGDQRRGDRSRSRDREPRVRMNISNLPHDMDEAELKDTVANYGKAGVLRIRPMLWECEREILNPRDDTMIYDNMEIAWDMKFRP